MRIPKPLQWISVGLAACLCFGLLWVFTEPEFEESWGELDPEFEAALASLEAWGGTCDLNNPETRALIEDSASIFDGPALACLASEIPMDHGWMALSKKARGEALVVLASHYYINRDERVLELQICDLQPLVRQQARSHVFSRDTWVLLQPHDYGFSIPENKIEALNEVFSCALWELDDYLAYDD